MNAMKEQLENSKKYSSTIMSDIASALSNKKVKFTMNENQTEIVTDKKEDYIQKLINSSIECPKESLKTLLEISKGKKKTYIRLRYL